MATRPRIPSSPYDRFASIYDRHMGADFASRVLPVIDCLLAPQLTSGSHVLDLCCGTGRVSAGLIERGVQVTGADASPAMVGLAKRNAPAARFLVSDVREMQLNPIFGAAVCTFNSLAHVYSREDLVRVFATVRQALKPSGAWLFDLSMEEAYVSRWAADFAIVDENECAIVQPSYDSRTRIARNEITMWHRSGAQLRGREQFTIVQKCHSHDEVTGALISAGFGRVSTYEAEAVGMRGEKGRTFFLAHLS